MKTHNVFWCGAAAATFVQNITHAGLAGSLFVAIAAYLICIGLTGVEL